MTPLIALDLSLDGIVVMSRAPEGPDHGKWWREGIVRLDADDMSEQLRRMRARCAARVGEDFTTILIIPESQILFTSLERDDRDPKVTIRSLLKGRTPYPVEDLTFDFVQRGDRLQVAVVALETLLEAESFAADFGFRPVALIGSAGDNTYPGIPDFGPTGIAAGLLDGDRLTLGIEDGFTVTLPPSPPEIPEAVDQPVEAEPHASEAAPDVSEPIAAPTPAPVLPEAVPPAVTPPLAGSEPAPAVPFPPAPDVRVTEPDPAIILPEVTAPAVPPAPPLPPKSVFPPAMPVAASPPRPRVEPLAPSAPDRPIADDLDTDTPPEADESAIVADEVKPADTTQPETVTASEGDATPAPDVPPPAAPPSTTEAVDAPATEGPVFARRASSPPKTDGSVTPTFSTRRHAPQGDTPRIEPGLSRITPRLSRPTPEASGDAEAAPVPPAIPAPKRPAALDDLPPVSADMPPPQAPKLTAPPRADVEADAPEAAEATTTPRTGPRLSALAGVTGLAGKAGSVAAAGLGRARGKARRLRPAPAPEVPSAEEQARLDEAQALALPGLARERAAAPAARGTGGRLGLYLTLSLLALLGAIGIWSVVFNDGPDLAGVAGSEDPQITATPSPDILPPPVSPGTGTGTNTSIADLVPAPGDEPVQPLEPDAAEAGSGAPDGPAADTDVALLLPDSRGGAVSPEPGEVIPPEMLPGATPEELVEDDNPGPDDETAPDIAVVTTEAEPFELPREIAAAPQTGTTEDIYLASIDPVIEGVDAVSLPSAKVPSDTFSPQTSPAPAGTDFDTGSDGLVVASAEGTLAPGGYSVVAGRPATLPQPRPGETEAQQATQSAENDAARSELARIRPVQRPTDAAERVERLTFNGFTREELTRTRPTQRPASIAEAAAEAEEAAAEQSAAVQAAAAAAVASLARPDDIQQGATAPAGNPPGPTSRYALAQSVRPRERPRSVERDAARIVTQRREQATPASAASTSLPAAADSSRQTVRSAGGSVARAATQSNAIRLREVNLIGIYGRPNARRALVRLSNGRYVKVEVGDRLERGRVVAIGESELVYQRGGRNVALRMPQT